MLGIGFVVVVVVFFFPAKWVLRVGGVALLEVRMLSCNKITQTQAGGALSVFINFANTLKFHGRARHGQGDGSVTRRLGSS